MNKAFDIYIGIQRLDKYVLRKIVPIDSVQVFVLLRVVLQMSESRPMYRAHNTSTQTVLSVKCADMCVEMRNVNMPVLCRKDVLTKATLDLSRCEPR